MKILAIETSCDDTCVAILKFKNLPPKRDPARGGKKSKVKIGVLSNVVSSQVKIHAKYGGVYPTLAKREHQRNLVPVLIRALKQSKLLKISKPEHINFSENLCARPSTKNRFLCSGPKFQILKTILAREELLYTQLKKFLEKYQKPDIGAIAVTIGPGLEPCLWVGVNFARTLSYFWNLPIIPINHIEAHIFANFVVKELKTGLFPAVSLIVSGGHTQLILIKGVGKYKIIGETRDDAAGECFDKVARILGLGYPGGPIVAKMATKIKNQNAKIKITLPRPMMYQKNYDFSFSGLKTAVLYDFKNRPLKIQKSKEYIQTMCAETQQAIIDVLIHKTIKAAKEYGAKTVILGGGVAANEELRKRFKIECLKFKVNFLIPPKNLCTDNAAMIGVLADYWQKRKTKKWQKIKALANLSIN